jgi:hypothetical protein
MLKLKALIFMLCLIMLSAGCSSEYWLDEGSGSTNHQSVSHADQQAQPRHGRQEKDFNKNVPHGLPDEIAFYTVVKDALDNPVEDAEVEVIFQGQDKFGEPLQYGQLLSDFRFTATTDYAGVAKFKLPTIFCYNFRAGVKAKKTHYYENAKRDIKIRVNGKPLKLGIWLDKQWKGANGDCDEQSTKKHHKIFGLF